MRAGNKTTNTKQAQPKAEMVRGPYCWVCDKRCTKSQNFSKCSGCFRAFHTTKCLEDVQKPYRVGIPWNCPVCLEMQITKQEYVGKQSMLDLLKYTMVDILKDASFHKLQEELETISDLSNPTDLKKMKQKTDDQQYESFEAFIIDAECILHSIKILGRASLASLCEIASNLVTFCKTQVENIESCVDCYKNQHEHPKEWRYMACSKPHILIWTRSGRRYMPVKLISMAKDDQIKVVRFDDGFVNISIENCYMYSSEPPVYGYDDENVLKQVKSYIKNTKEKFGTFHLASKGSRFYRKRLDAHIKATFPDYKHSGDGGDEVPSPPYRNCSESSFSEEDNDHDEYKVSSGEGSSDDSDNDDVVEANINTVVIKRRHSEANIQIDTPTTSRKSSCESGGTKHSSSSIGDIVETTETPLKKQRISFQRNFENFVDHQYDENAANDSGFVDSNLPSNFQPSSSIESSVVQSWIKSIQSDIIESVTAAVQVGAMKFVNMSQLRVEAIQNELKKYQEKNAEYEQMQREIEHKMQLVASERASLVSQIQTITHEREVESLQAKQAIANAQIQHANEIAHLNKLYDQAVNQNQSLVARIQFEEGRLQEKVDENKNLKTRVRDLSARIQSIIAKRNQDNSSAQQAIEALKWDQANEREQLDRLHEQAHTENQEKLNELHAQIELMNGDIAIAQKQRDEAKKTLEILRDQHTKTVKKQRQHLETSLQRKMKEFQAKLEKEHRSQLKEIHAQHKQELDAEVQRAVDKCKAKIMGIFPH